MMNKQKQHAKLLKVMTKADKCVERHKAQKLILKAEKIQARLEKQSFLLTMSTIVMLSLFSGFAIGTIAATLIVR